MADQHHVDVAQALSAVGTLLDRLSEAARLLGHAGIPTRALDEPRHHVLEPAEHRPSFAGRLGYPVAVVALHRLAAPGAGLGHGYIEPGCRGSSCWRATRPARSCSSRPCACSTPR